ncbi:porin [Rugamonas apoptosis]|nr:porin [Rugamonas apoptosis]
MQKTLMVTALLAAMSGQAHAQTGTPQDLQQALVQAQKAAADAMLAAQQAQEALAKIQQANAASAASSSAAPAAPRTATVTQPAGEGLVYRDGGDFVRLYGLIDLSLSHKSNANAAGDTLNDMSVAYFSGNRWGLEGQHALKDTDGLKAIFMLESEYELPTGSMDTPGVLFNRDAWLGLESDALGKLTLGRQNTVAREFSKIYGDPYGSAGVTLEEGGYSNNNNFKQLIFYSGSATGTRYDKGIVWKKKIGDFVLGAGYQLGGIPGDFDTGSTKSLGLAYNAGRFNLSGFYNTANVNGFTHTSYSVGGNYKVGPVRLNAGYIHYRAEQPSLIGDRQDKAYTVSAKFTPGGKLDYEAGWQTMNADNAAVNGGGFVLNAYANTANATHSVTGKRKTLYGSVFYHFDKRTELYLALDRLTTDGGYLAAQANGFKSQSEAATGMRFKF